MVITSFSIFILPLLNATILLSRKNNIGLYNDLCIKAIIDMEDNCLLNLDKLINFIYKLLFS